MVCYAPEATQTPPITLEGSPCSHLELAPVLAHVSYPLVALEMQLYHFSLLSSASKMLPTLMNHFYLLGYKHAVISSCWKNKTKLSFDSTSPASFYSNSLLTFAAKGLSILASPDSFPPVLSETYSSQAFVSIPVTKLLMLRSPERPTLPNPMTTSQSTSFSSLWHSQSLSPFICTFFFMYVHHALLAPFPPLLQPFLILHFCVLLFFPRP